jgi:hypothetical protein
VIAMQTVKASPWQLIAAATLVALWTVFLVWMAVFG